MSGSQKKTIEPSDEVLRPPLKISGLEAAHKSDERLQASARKSNTKNQGFAEHSLVGIYIVQDGIVSFVNPKALEIFGYSRGDILEMPLPAIIIADDCRSAERNFDALLSGNEAVTHFIVRGKRKDGAIIEIEIEGTKTEINGRPAVIGTFIDSTELKRIEAEIRKDYNLESLSSFAGGVAREFNDILTAIMGNLALAKMYAKPGYEVYDVLTEAEKASLRARDLTSQLLSFAAGGVQLKKVVFIGELLRDIIRFSITPNEISCELTVPDSLWTVEVDESQIGQVISTLIRYLHKPTLQNSRIRISADNLTLTRSSGLPLMEGSYVMTAIKGSGNGISDAELQTLFEPFSSKDRKGSGLEVASALVIAQKHNGHITAENMADGDIMFRLFLPASQERPSLTSGSFAGRSSRKGRVLVMDDEEIVRVVIERLLLQCGFETVLVKDGNEMLRLYKEAKEASVPYDAVILDLIIQNGMGGQEAMKSLIEYDPDVKVIVSSGYSNNPVMANYRDYGFSGFLPKPYKLDELKRAMCNIVGDR